MSRHEIDKIEPLTKAQFTAIQTMVKNYIGIELADQKKTMVDGRLIRRLRALNMSTFDQYIAFLKTNKQELQNFVNEITTNVTRFFRENHHFEFVSQTLLPALYAEKKNRIRFWSAGCSSGQEPYSLAITIAQLPPPTKTDLKILATDISTKVLEMAKAGTYPLESVDKIDKPILNKYFIKQKNKDEVIVNQDLHQYITFNQLNLMDPWPFSGPFQLIMCRNVIIYFGKETQVKLFERYAKMLEMGGYLILGHSEHIFGMQDVFKPVGNTIYQKIGEPRL